MIKSIRLEDKRGIILKEVITLVISVLCLIILFYLAFQLYGVLIKKSSLEQAKANLDQISSIINRLEEGGSGDFLLLSPKNWFFIVYNKGLESPASCFNKECICFCPELNIQSCEKQGVCNSFNIDKIQMVNFQITAFFDLQFIRNKDTLTINFKLSENKR